ncbi:MAG: hypothetical protein KF830_04255 [Planctomycetes bacterium]|nr:hypothetical protein [Planctomycetota bacterium]
MRELVRRLEGLRFGVAARALGVVLPLVLALAPGGGLAAQAPPTTAAAVAAYRAGDYAAAESVFAALYAASGDRRFLQARGNCLYRLGDLPRALWAYESARLGRPRDPELLSNVRLVRRRLELDDGGTGFGAELLALRERLTPVERLLAGALLMLVAAGGLLAGWRRSGWRWVGALALLPAAVVAIDLVWLEPQRPPRAIALQRLSLLSEPRAGLEPVAVVRAGVEVDLLGGAEGAFVRIAAGDRSGYAPRSAIAVVD